MGVGGIGDRGPGRIDQPDEVEGRDAPAARETTEVAEERGEPETELRGELPEHADSTEDAQRARMLQDQLEGSGPGQHVEPAARPPLAQPGLKPEERYERGRAAFERGDFATAQDEFQAAHDDPSITQDQRRRFAQNVGQCQQELENHPAAVRSFEESLEGDSLDPTQRATAEEGLRESRAALDESLQYPFEHARNAFDRGDYETARRGFTQIHDDPNLDPSRRGEVAYDIARSEQRLGNDGPAIQRYEEAIATGQLEPADRDRAQAQIDGMRREAEPANRERFNQANGAFERGDFDTAAREWNAMSQDPTVDPARRGAITYDAARAEQRAGRNEDAIRHYQEAIDSGTLGRADERRARQNIEECQRTATNPAVPPGR